MALLKAIRRKMRENRQTYNTLHRMEIIRSEGAGCTPVECYYVMGRGINIELYMVRSKKPTIFCLLQFTTNADVVDYTLW